MEKKEASKLSMYEELNFFDVIEPILPILNDGRFYIGEDGLIHRRAKISHESPWLFAKHDLERKCALWAQVMFRFYHIIPRGCQNCWKIACRPRNLKEAFAMLEVQKELGLPSKTGMEQREYTGHLGGWFSCWYCPIEGGLGEARKIFARVKKAVRARFSNPPVVTLKRGCTEMEQTAGASDKWAYSKATELKEEMIDAVFAPIAMPDHPRFLVVRITKQWIKWAVAYNDKTCFEYTGGPMLPQAVTYNNSIHSDRDYSYIERGSEYASNRDKGSDCCGSETCKCESRDGGSKIVLV